MSEGSTVQYMMIRESNGQEYQNLKVKSNSIKKKVERANAFLDGNRIMGGSGSGKMKMYHTEDAKALTIRILKNPDQTFTLIGDYHDPDEMAQGANMKVAFKGMSFDEVTLLGFKVKDLVDDDFPFTFDDFEIIE